MTPDWYTAECMCKKISYMIACQWHIISLSIVFAERMEACQYQLLTSFLLPLFLFPRRQHSPHIDEYSIMSDPFSMWYFQLGRNQFQLVTIRHPLLPRRWLRSTSTERRQEILSTWTGSCLESQDILFSEQEDTGVSLRIEWRRIVSVKDRSLLPSERQRRIWKCSLNSSDLANQCHVYKQKSKHKMNWDEPWIVLN